MKAVICVGISASGKSTFAKELVEQGWMDVNRDDLRFEMFCNGVRDWSLYKFTKERENRVTQAQENMVDGASVMGMNAVISDTNINDKTRNFWIKRLTDLGYDVELKYFDIDLIEALERDAKRSNGVGYKVITDQYRRYMKLRHGDNYHKREEGLVRAIIVDIDGTLADMEGIRKPFDWDKVHLDEPREHIIRIVDDYFFETPERCEVIFVSGRDSICMEATRQWLSENVGDWTDSRMLLMRPQGDMRKDTVVKKEIYHKYIEGRYNIDYVIDDRYQVIRMWEFELGLDVIKVGKIHNEF